MKIPERGLERCTGVQQRLWGYSVLSVFRTVDRSGATTRVVQVDYLTGQGALYYTTGEDGVVSFDAMAISGDEELAGHMLRWLGAGETLQSGWGE